MVNHKELEKVIYAYVQAKQPLFIWGHIGIGKSTTVKKVAQKIARDRNLIFTEDWSRGNDEKSFCFIDVRLSTLEASDVYGIPDISTDSKYVHWKHPIWQPDKGEGIIFADELNLAPISIQSAMYQLILDRRLNEYVLPEGYTIVSAGNFVEDSSNVYDMPSGLHSRFGHIVLDNPDPDSFNRYCITHGIDSRIVGFLQQFPDYIYKIDENAQYEAQPIPRCWEKFSDLLRFCDDYDSIELMGSTLVGCGIAQEFVAFLNLSRDFDFERILNDDRYEIPSTDASVTYSIASNLPIYVKAHKKKIEKAFKVLSKFEKISPEYAILYMRCMKSAIPDFEDIALKNVEFRENVERYYKYL